VALPIFLRFAAGCSPRYRLSLSVRASLPLSLSVAHSARRHTRTRGTHNHLLQSRPQPKQTNKTNKTQPAAEAPPPRRRRRAAASLAARAKGRNKGSSSANNNTPPAPTPLPADDRSRRAESYAVTRTLQTGSGATSATTEQTPTTVARLSVTVPAGLVTAAFNRTVDTLRTQVVGDLKGFRPGNVPLAMVVQRVGGQDNFKGAVLEEVLHSALPAVMAAHARDAVPQSERIATDARELRAAFDPAKPLDFAIEYVPLPPVRWLKPFKDIEVTVKETGNLETDAEAAEALIRQYRKEKGRQRVAAGRGLSAGDVAIVSMRVDPADGMGPPFPGLTRDKFAFDTDEDPLSMVPHLLGAGAGEERVWEFEFPSDWHVELWRGQRAKSTVRVLELFEWDLPDFDDDFVRQHFGPGTPSARGGVAFDGADDMRKSLVAATTLERLKASSQSAQDLIVEALASCVELEVPDAMIRLAGEKEYERRLMAMLQEGAATPDDLPRLTDEKTVSEFIRDRRADLIEEIKFNAAASSIFESEKLSIPQEVVEQEAASAAEQFKADGMEYDEDVLRSDILARMEVMAVMDHLQSKCVKVNTVAWEGDWKESLKETKAAAAGSA
jgi:trigger factor